MCLASFCPVVSFSFYGKMNSITHKAHSLSETSTHPLAFERRNQRKANKQIKETHRARVRVGWDGPGGLWCAWLRALRSSFSRLEVLSGHPPSPLPYGTAPPACTNLLLLFLSSKAHALCLSSPGFPPSLSRHLVCARCVLTLRPDRWWELHCGWMHPVLGKPQLFY